MKLAARLALAAFLTLATLPLAVAHDARAAALARGGHVYGVEGYIPYRPDGRVAALGIGSPAGFASLNSWVTTEPESELYPTYPFWCDYEFLHLFGFFYSERNTTTVTTLQIRSQSGELFFNEMFTDAAYPQEINGIIFHIGELPVGAYKVLIKHKQGTKIVGQTYWIAVAACEPPAEPEP